MAFIKVSDLEFSYPKAKEPTLSIPGFQVGRGEKVFLFGPSGAGKTTFLEILAGVLLPQKGRVEIGGTALTDLSSRDRDRFRGEKMAFIFQNFNLLPYLSAAENILLPLRLASGLTAAHEKRLTELAKVLGIDQILGSPVTEMSVGQQQRVAVARALISSPELILADEPTSSLDHDARERFLKTLFELCGENKTTLVFVSHDRGLKDLFDRQVDLAGIHRRAAQ